MRVMSPLEFMQRLAARVPRPRLHLDHFHGVMAPHAKLPTRPWKAWSTAPPTAELDVARVRTQVASTGAEALGLDRRRAELEHRGLSEQQSTHALALSRLLDAARGLPLLASNAQSLG